MIDSTTLTITLAKNENLQVVVPADATEYEPYILKDGGYYDTAFFRPINPKPKQKMLCTEHCKQAKLLLGESRAKWDAMMAGKQRHEPQIQSEPQPRPQQAPAPQPAPTGTLDQIITQLVAQSASAAVMESVKPMIESYVRERYGSLPQIITVSTPNFGQHTVKGMMAKEFEDVLKMVTAGIPVFLTGPAGCGKNVMCKQIADALGLEFYFSNAVTQEYKISGFIDANGAFQDTQFYKAITNGGLFMLDEIDASVPEVLVALNAAIANGYFDFPNGKVEAHENFRLIAAGNTVGTGADAQYTGRYQLDASSLDRFAIVHVGYDRDIETAIAGDDGELVEFVEDFRNAVGKANILFAVTYRAIGRLAKMTKMFDIKKAIRYGILGGLEQDDIRVIANNMTCTNKYVTALKAI